MLLRSAAPVAPPLKADESLDDAGVVAAGIAERGGRELHLGWGDLPWRHFADPSGNEFCLLPARQAPRRTDQ